MVAMSSTVTKYMLIEIVNIVVRDKDLAKKFVEDPKNKGIVMTMTGVLGALGKAVQQQTNRPTSTYVVSYEINASSHDEANKYLRESGVLYEQKNARVVEKTAEGEFRKVQPTQFDTDALKKAANEVRDMFNNWTKP